MEDPHDLCDERVVFGVTLHCVFSLLIVCVKWWGLVLRTDEFEWHTIRELLRDQYELWCPQWCSNGPWVLPSTAKVRLHDD